MLAVKLSISIIEPLLYSEYMYYKKVSFLYSDLVQEVLLEYSEYFLENESRGQ
jgi:hypothetical protein